MDIYLVRHGEAAASWSQSEDPGLSDRGLRQARSAADKLSGVVPNRVRLVSSPLTRAMETAAPLAERLSSPLEINEAYREIPAPVPLPRRQDWLRAFMRQAWSDQPPALWEWRDRILQHLSGSGTPVVIFTHFLVINTIVGEVMQRDETLSFWPDNGSITHLRKRDGALELIALGRQMDTAVN
jgi:probable phosphoglycerate mutase